MAFSPGGVGAAPSLDQGALGVGGARALGVLPARGELSAAAVAFVRLTNPMGIVDNTVLRAVPREFAKDFTEPRPRASTIASLSAALAQHVNVAVTVDPSVEEIAA